MILTGHLRNTIKHAINLWARWDLHMLILASLAIQLILMFAAPLRKKTTRWYAVALIWCAYQLTDTAIAHALSSLYSAETQPNKAGYRKALYTLWAALILFHFGGPDTITALSVEDNRFWRRSMGRLILQLLRTSDIVAGATSRDLQSQPLILYSVVVVLYAGLEKSVERIVCMRKASGVCFQWSLVPRTVNPGLDYAAILDEYQLCKSRGVPVKFVDEDFRQPATIAPAGTTTPLKALSQVEIARQAWNFYDKLKGTYADWALCCHDRAETRGVFLQIPPPSAWEVVETEMNFAYEAFYTKAHLFTDLRWRAARFTSFMAEAAAVAFLLPTIHLFESSEVVVTACLLAGTIFMDILAYLRLYLSDWNIGQRPPPSSTPFPYIPALYMRKRRWGEYPQATPLLNRLLRTRFRHWSESVSQLNLIDYCITKRPQWRSSLYTCLGAKDMMDGHRYVTARWLTDDLRGFIFEELNRTSSVAQGLDRWEQANSSRGAWTLRCNACDDLDTAPFEKYILEVEYDESLIIWHIATELCYETESSQLDAKEQEYRVFSKVLSDYMMYLAVRQPQMMSQVAPMAKIIFAYSSEEATRLFRKTSLPSAYCGEYRETFHAYVCRTIKEWWTEVPPSYIKEKENHSVLFDGSILAKELRKLQRNRWKFVSQMWVELLCFAASGTPGGAHVTLLAKGGELVTLVRLLMLHFGLSSQFRRAKCSPIAKLCVGS